jgi:hypothetical protein
LAAELPREHVRRALEGLHELISVVREMSPIEAAIADLERREASLATREAQLQKRLSRRRSASFCWCAG